MFGFSTTVDEVIAGVDLTGKTVVVTGAASGLGLQTVTTLSNAGAEVVAAVRDPAAMSELAECVHPVPLDLASLDSVRAASALIAARHPAIDILINNAGVMFTPHGTTDDGYALAIRRQPSRPFSADDIAAAPTPGRRLGVG